VNPPALAVVAAVLGALAGAATPAVVRRLPVPDAEVDPQPVEQPGERPGERPPDYPAIASVRRLGSVAAIVGALTAGMLGLLVRPALVPAAVLVAAGGVVLGYVDLREHLLPERVLWPISLGTTLLLTAASGWTHDWRRLGVAVAVAAGCFTLFIVLALLAGGGLGFGDVQLVTLLGLVAGWDGLGTGMLMLVLAIALAGSVTLVLLLAGRVHRRQPVAFGPFLLVGWWGALLLAPQLLARS